MDRRKEAFYVWGFFTILVFGVVICMGTLTSGFHMVDDWELAKYTDRMTLEKISLWECMKDAVGFDLQLRFRPLYYVNRVLMAFLFGINLTAMSVIKAVEIVVAHVALYYCARQMKCGMACAALFALTVMVGYQSAVWWKLGPQESYAMMLFAIGFYLLLKWLHGGAGWYAYASVAVLFLMSIYKEPFILLLPFVGLYVLYEELRDKKFSAENVWKAVKSRLPYLLAIGMIFVVELLLIAFVIGTNNYSYVGLDKSITFRQYIETWHQAGHADLKWYRRFGVVMLMILLTYWEQSKKLLWEIALTMAIIVPQCVAYSKTALEERYILPSVLGFAFFFVITGCHFRPLRGRRRMVYMLCLLLMLAAHGRVMLREAHYFAYRGEGIQTMLESTLALVQGTDRKVLSCFAPNPEGNKTIHYWFRLHDYEEVFYWDEETKIIERSFGPRWEEQAALEEIDVVMMYNREDRHWCYEPSLDLSDFTKHPCGTVTMYVRKEN